MKSTAKFLFIATICTFLAISIWQVLIGDGIDVNIDGDQIDGPMGAVLGVLFASGGMAIAAVVCVGVAVFLGVLFAGLGVLLVGGMALLAMVCITAVAPLLLPLMIVVAIYYFMRNRRQRRQHLALDQAV
jgi:hypothetical protein